ncbi:hypothetical protein ACWGLP_22835 [Streptomyces lydicus]|uniref:hypothetical protein n=1 Tax=Streptomyces lydicus TaxID=47763 RepID=UPI0037D586EF
MKRQFNSSEIEVIDFDDATSGEHVIEFRDPDRLPSESILAISLPNGGRWEDATLSVSPRQGDIQVSFALWAINVAKERLA